MKTPLLKFSAFAGVLLFLVMIFSASSCKKDKTCHGKVHVVDTAGASVASATVKLAAPSVGGQVTYTGITDGAGNANFEVKLPAIFDVTATKSTFPGMTGIGVLRLDEPGKSAEITVKIQ